jgi:hypothetical protein
LLANASNKISEFHKYYNRKSFKEIYFSANPTLKTSVSEDDFQAQLFHLYQTTGAEVSTLQTFWKVYTFNTMTSSQRKILINMDTVFENGTREEIFTYLIDDNNNMTLYDYKVQEVFSK